MNKYRLHVVIDVEESDEAYAQKLIYDIIRENFHQGVLKGFVSYVDEIYEDVVY